MILVISGLDFNFMKKYTTYLPVFTLGLFIASCLPASAATFASLVDNLVGGLAVSVIRLLFAAAFIFFFWGVVQYTVMPGSEAKDKGRGYMVWGLIALTIMFSIYGTIKVVQETFIN